MLTQLVALHGTAARDGVAGLERLCLNVPELAPDLATDARAGEELLEAFVLNLNPIQSFIVVHDIFGQVFVDAHYHFAL